MVRSERVQNEKLSNFSTFHPEFCSEFSQIFPGLFVLCFLGNGDHKKFTKNPRHFFQCQISMQSERKKSQKFSENWRAGGTNRWCVARCMASLCKGKGGNSGCLGGCLQLLQKGGGGGGRRNTAGGSGKPTVSKPHPHVGIIGDFIVDIQMSVPALPTWNHGVEIAQGTPFPLLIQHQKKGAFGKGP